jgi:penicillin-binding protein 1C
MKLARAAVLVVAGLCAAALAPALEAIWIGPPSLNVDLSAEVTDRSGLLLRAFPAAGDRFRLRTEPADVDDGFIKLLIAVEDRRFSEHAGVDPQALIRAAWQDLSHGRIISGASTLTMQTVTLLTGDRHRTVARKIRQATYAFLLERRHSKGEILATYLKLAPFGGNIEGVRTASLAYFRHEPRHLSLAESATLIALAQAPERRRPDRHPMALRTARDRIIDLAVASGVVPAAEAQIARLDELPARSSLPFLAPHAAARWHALLPGARTIALTLDRDLQQRVERAVAERLRHNPLGLQAAVIVVDNRTGELRASVGSAGYFAGNGGMFDHTRAVRSPGSTLKPFIYGLAFDTGLIETETLLDDRRMRFGNWAPNNFDGRFSGTVSVREALQASLNLPAVDVLNALGPERLRNKLAQIAVPLRLSRGAPASLAIALGGAGIRLIDLVQGYTALARSGAAVSLIERSADRGPQGLGTFVLPQSAYQIYDILRDAPPPEARPRGMIAFKTGTSFGFRDALALGFDHTWTVGVWLGRPDGSPVPGLYGRNAAAPLLFDIFGLRGNPYDPLPQPGQVVAGRGVGYFSSQVLQRPLDGSAPLRILFPIDGSSIEADQMKDVALEASGGVAPFQWFIDGRPELTSMIRRQAMWTPESLGFTRITVIDRTGASNTVRIRLVQPEIQRALAH